MALKSSFLHGPQLPLWEGGPIHIYVIRTWPCEPSSPPSLPRRLGHRGGALTCCPLLPPPPSESVPTTLWTRSTHFIMAELISSAKVGLKSSQIAVPQGSHFQVCFPPAHWDNLEKFLELQLHSRIALCPRHWEM